MWVVFDLFSLVWLVAGLVDVGRFWLVGSSWFWFVFVLLGWLLVGWSVAFVCSFGLFFAGLICVGIASCFYSFLVGVGFFWLVLVRFGW